MTSLIDRYIHTALRRVPEQQRGDIDRELRASIDDAVDARVESGEDRDAAIESTLTDLGDPGKLADRYAGRPNFLIGPELFGVWRRVLTALLVTVLPLIVVIGAVVQFVDDPDVGKIIGGAVSAVLTVGTQIVFWVTFAFAVLERTGTAPKGLNRPWTVQDLPRHQPNAVARGEVGAGVVWPVLLIAGLVLQQFSLGAVPVLNPANWTFWWPYLIVALALGAAYHVWLYRRGAYDRTVSVVNAAQQLITTVPLVWLLATDRFFNPRFGWFADLGPHVDVKHVLTKALIAVLVAGAAFDIGKVTVRGERARRA